MFWGTCPSSIPRFWVFCHHWPRLKVENLKTRPHHWCPICVHLSFFRICHHTNPRFWSTCRRNWRPTIRHWAKIWRRKRLWCGQLEWISDYNWNVPLSSPTRAYYCFRSQFRLQLFLIFCNEEIREIRILTFRTKQNWKLSTCQIVNFETTDFYDSCNLNWVDSVDSKCSKDLCNLK